MHEIWATVDSTFIDKFEEAWWYRQTIFQLSPGQFLGFRDAWPWCSTGACAGHKFVATKSLPKTNRAHPRETLHVHFDTAIASPRFKTKPRACWSPLGASSPARSHFARFGASLKPLTMEQPSRALPPWSGYRLDGARVARDSAFWSARYLDRNKFTLNYLPRYSPGRSFNTSHPRPCALSPSVPSSVRSHPRSSNNERSICFVVGADFNFLILLCASRHSRAFSLLITVFFLAFNFG